MERGLQPASLDGLKKVSEIFWRAGVREVKRRERRASGSFAEAGAQIFFQPGEGAFKDGAVLPVREIGEVIFADSFRQIFAGVRVQALPFFQRRVIRQRDGIKFVCVVVGPDPREPSRYFFAPFLTALRVNIFFSPNFVRDQSSVNE
jgi:hypothetical protein